MMMLMGVVRGENGVVAYALASESEMMETTQFKSREQ